jgi:membrane protease YdiL (CAAX protease family)
VVILSAVFFTAGHHAFYGLASTEIDWLATLTLFSFGGIANLLFVRYGHVGYPFAIHYAWNLERFNAQYYLDGTRISEGATFDFIEGAPWVAVAASTIFVAMFVFFSRRIDADARRIAARCRLVSSRTVTR